MKGSYLGPKFDNNIIERKLKDLKANFIKNTTGNIFKCRKRIIEQ